MIKIEHIEHHSPGDFITKMIDAQGDYRYLSSGSYGTVFGSHKTDIVYKFGDIKSNFAYLTFVKIVIKLSKPNPFFPKIYGVRYIHGPRAEDDMFVVAMERLRELPIKVWNNFEPLMTNSLEDEPFVSKLNNTVNQLGYELRPSPALQEAIQLVKKVYNKYSHNDKIVYDLHRGNFMCRHETGHPIFTDPFA